MIKVNLSDGDSLESSQSSDSIPGNVKSLARKFWKISITDGIGIEDFPIFRTKRLGLYNTYPKNSNKYVLLKIHNIEKLTKAGLDPDKNIPKWCKNGKAFEFFNDDINNITTNPTKTTSEIFGLHRNDLKEMRRELFGSTSDNTNHKAILNAVLYENLEGKNAVWFFLTKDESFVGMDAVVLFGQTIGSSGVKVPRGGA
jgi:hypothetical protein